MKKLTPTWSYTLYALYNNANAVIVSKDRFAYTLSIYVRVKKQLQSGASK